MFAAGGLFIEKGGHYVRRRDKNKGNPPPHCIRHLLSKGGRRNTGALFIKRVARGNAVTGDCFKVGISAKQSSVSQSLDTSFQKEADGIRGWRGVSAVTGDCLKSKSEQATILLLTSFIPPFQRSHSEYERPLYKEGGAANAVTGDCLNSKSEQAKIFRLTSLAPLFQRSHS